MSNKKFIRILSLFLISFLIISSLGLISATTWTDDATRFTVESQYDGYPVVAQMQNGDIWLVWSRTVPSGLALYYQNSSNLGRTWSAKRNLTKVPTDSYNQNPSIMQAANGTIWLVWTSNRLQPAPPPMPDFHMNATPASLTIPLGDTDNSTITVTSIYDFNDPVSLSAFNEPEDVNATFTPTTVTPPTNSTTTSNLTVSVGLSATPGNYTLTVRGRSGKISHFVNVDLEIIEFSGSSGVSRVYASSLTSEPSQQDDYEVYLKTSHDDGVTWSNDTQLTHNMGDDMRPSIIQLANGTIMLVWQSEWLGNDEILYATTTDGINWSDPTPLTADPEHDGGPHVAQAIDGRIWVAWSTRRNGEAEIFYKTYYGTSWSSDTRFTNNTDSDVAPWIFQTIDGTIMIFWATRPSTSEYDIYYRYTSDNGASWSEDIQSTTDNAGDTWPSACQVRDTTIWLVWTSNRADQPDGNWDVWYRTSLAGDVNEDGVVDVWDISIVSQAYGTFNGAPGYNPDADLNKDGIVDMIDLSIVAIHYGET